MSPPQSGGAQTLFLYPLPVHSPPLRQQSVGTSPTSVAPRRSRHHSAALVAWASDVWHGNWGRRCRTGALRSRLSALSWCYRAFCGFTVDLTPKGELLFQNLAAVEPTPRLAKHAASIPLLWAAHDLMNLESVTDRVILGATGLAFIFLLRKSEYACAPTKGKDHRIRVKHLLF